MKLYIIRLKYIKKICRKNYKKENYIKNLKNNKILVDLSSNKTSFIHFLASYGSMYALQYDMQDQMALPNRLKNQSHNQP